MAGIPQVITEDRASGAQVVEGSLKFDSSKAQYLKRKPTVDGNRKLWTWSGWLKRTPGALHDIFSAGQEVANDGLYSRFRIDSDDYLNYRQWVNTSSLDAYLVSSMKLRDPSAYFHYVAIYDSSNSTNSDKVRFYINGQRVTLFSSNDYPGGTNSSWVNSSSKTHTIGGHYDGGSSADSFWNGYMSQVYFLDGIAAGPEYFGFTDPLTNTWRPKKFEHLSTSIATQYSGASALTWDDNPIGSIYTLSNGNRTATAGQGTSSGYTGADVWSNAIPADSTTAWTLEITNSDSVGGWYFADSQTPSGTHPDERGGNSMGLRNQDADAAFRGTFATANGYSNSGNQLSLPGCETFGSRRVDFVVYRPASGTGKVWVKDNGASTWVGGGDPSNTGSTPSFVIPDGNTYFGYTFYDRSNGDQIATFDGDGSIHQKAGANSFYLPMDGNTPIGKDQSGRGNDWTPIGFGGSVELPKATGAIPILNTNEAGTVAKPSPRTDSQTYTVTASGGNYYLDGALKPTLNAYRGSSLTFDYTGATSHPFYLSSLSDGKYNSKAYSVSFDGSGDALRVPDHTDLRFGTDAFTIECYVWFNSFDDNYPSIISKYTGGTASWIMRVRNNGAAVYYSAVGGGSNEQSSAGVISLGKWHHMAMVREGTGSNQAKMYVDGRLVVTATDSTDYTDTQEVTIGAQNASDSNVLNGYMSNVRIIKGTALYTSEFTPPGTTLTNVTGTKLLCCQDSDATTGAVLPTGAAITVAGNPAVTQSKQPFLYDNNHGNFGVNTATSNTTKITIPHLAADTLYYYCQNHSGMGSSINVTTDIRKADPYAWKCVLATPLLGNKDDVSDKINTTSTAKSTTLANQTVASYASSNFYGGSYYFDGTGDDIDATITALGTRDFTLEGWNETTATSALHILFEYGDHSSNGFIMGIRGTSSSNNIFVRDTTSGSAVDVANATYNSPYSFGRGWHHFALQRSSNVVTLFVDGIRVGTATYNSNYSSTNLRIGNATYAAGSSEGMLGYIQDVRLYDGIAKYSSSIDGEQAFVVPSTSPDILPDTPSGITSKTNLAKSTEGAVTGFDSSSDYLTLAASSDFEFTGDHTIEMFIYHNTLAGDSVPFATGGSGAPDQLYINTNGEFYYAYGQTGNINSPAGTIVVNKWQHIAVSKQGTNLRMFVDGKIVASSTNHSSTIGSSSAAPYIGVRGGADHPVEGFISNLRVVKGTALYTSEFTPPTEPLTAVTNTKLLCCQSNTSATAAAVAPGSITANGNAAATKFNPFTNDINTIRGQASGYATFNPISEWIDSGTVSEGNLTFTSTSGGNARGTATIRPTSGKWYCEFSVIDATRFCVGVENTNKQTSFQGGGSTNSVIVFYSRPAYYNSTSFNNYLDASMSNGDIIQVALDLDNTAVWIGRNNIWGGGASSSEIVNGVATNSLTSFIGSTTPLTGDVGIFVEDNSGSGAMSAGANFGQKPFKFPPPDGFQPLNLSNVQPENVIARPDQYVDVSLWSGNGTSQTITGLKHKPDFVWIKKRAGGTARSHQLFDSVRGVYNTLHPNSVSVEDNNTNRLTAFNQDGFAVGGDDGANGSSGTFVGWTWKAGGSKGIFNVDDVVYANASDLNMSVGALNSVTFDKSQNWTSQITGTENGSYPFANMFNGDGQATHAYPANGTRATFTPSPSFSNAKTVKVWYYAPTINSDTFQLNGVDVGDQMTTTGGTLTKTFNVDGFTSWSWSKGVGGDDSGMLRIDVDGVQLVDSGVSTPNVPATAATGCSVGTKQGFSIVSYTSAAGDGVSSVPHGLSQTPDFVLIKNRDTAVSSQGWPVWHSGVPNKSRYLDSTNAWDATEFGHVFNSTAPTSNVVTVRANSAVSSGNRFRSYGNGDDFIMYCWHNVPGLQKFGSYTSTGTTNGPFVELGFRPAILWIKNSARNGEEWVVYDNRRQSYNPNGATLYLNADAAEYDGNSQSGGNSRNVDFLSNGFKINDVGNPVNISGQTEVHIYCAWAEAPSINMYGAQSNAR